MLVLGDPDGKAGGDGSVGGWLGNSWKLAVRRIGRLGFLQKKNAAAKEKVIHAPDFRESKAANGIRKQMKTMIELTRQLRNEPFPTKSKEEHPKEQPLMGAIKEEKKENRENQMPQSQNGELPYSSDNAQQPKESAMPLGERSKGTYVIGGSPVGLNFMVYPGTCPIYYGVTKASFCTRHIAS